MKFKKYGSIENHYRMPYIIKVKSCGEFKEDVNWRVEEKVHGANLSLWFDGDEFKIAKRSSFIGKESGFFSVWDKWDELAEKTKNVYDLLKGINDNIKEIVIYGEWFGGSFPGEITKNSKKVQSGIAYCPQNEFYAFDLTIDDVVMPSDMMNICKTAGFFVTEPLFEGTLDECLKHSNEFPSTIPGRLGFEFPVTEDNQNICEGIVIKPVVPMFIGESRMIFKSKNEKFAEINGSKHKDKQPKVIPPGFLELMNEVENYVTDNRLSNVLSKEGISDDDLSPKHIGTLIVPVFEDVLEDYSKDNDFDLESLDAETQKLTRKHLSFKIVTLIKERMGMVK